ncbi:MAG: DUF3192 domain-containing protein [Gemmatimonadota bacterium]
MRGRGRRGGPRPFRFAARGSSAALLTALVGVACATAVGFRERNRENLERLRVGMIRSEVFELMGAETVRALGTEAGMIGAAEDSLAVSRIEIPVGGPRPVLRNPHRNATYEAAGHVWEVLFYYTELVEDDGLVTDDELTPVVLRDGILVGWGWRHWADQVARHGIPAEIPSLDVQPPGPHPEPPAGRAPGGDQEGVVAAFPGRADSASSRRSISSMIPSIRRSSAL